MIDFVKYLVGVICLIVAAFKGLQLRRQESVSAAGWYTVVCFFLLGLAAFAIAPGTLRAASSFEPFPNFARWVGNSLAVAAGWCVFAILAHTVRDPAKAQRLVVRQAIIAGLVVVAMGVLLVAGHTRFTTEFVTVYGKRPSITAYLALFSAYLSWAFVAFIALIRRYSAATPDRPLRAGLRIMMLGAFAGLLWAAWKTIVLVINQVAPHPVRVEALVTALLSSSAEALIAAGGIVALAFRFVRVPLERARTARYCRQLEPLWSQMYRALPEIKLAPIEQGDEFSVYRRVIEIRDANLALRAHCHPDVRRWAVEAARQAGITGEKADVIAEAAVIAGAIDAHAAGVGYPAESAAVEMHRGTGDIESERDWLIRVSRAFAGDPIVQQVRGRAISALQRENR
ncbi:hypothetical protein IU494_30500 [Nocardia terpenica]|uniref:MAB_1171c family putative transporter n=1 Tax=Nocardia terpenica TaxID=455432 RepID=UPI0018962FCF|nr:MAB_1171c family putative transporter [Nocardia terpenica]MBF6064979.1 hypothetical protein [Nocardia terpenica]MBF6115251.1 hypothetical protein [Nocardia terpenica]MBF6122573.1 hypothetical protein [Nocardia terpenica]